MKSKYDQFRKLHRGDVLFVLANAWDAESAKMLESCGYAAIGTSSAAVASVLGYPDGEVMPFGEYLTMIRRIAASVSIPVTVDMEMGYGKTPEQVYDNLQRLIDVGVAGINIEDSEMVNSQRSLRCSEEFSELLSGLRAKLEAHGESLFLNVRCDTYLLKVENVREETAERVKRYEAAGADGIFLPFICEESAIRHARSLTSLPLNVMVMPDLPDLGQLNELGVKRVSMGPFLQMKTYHTSGEIARLVLAENTLKPLV